MEDAGRNYIVLATALITLAAAFHHYNTIEEEDAAVPERIVTEAFAEAQCDLNSIQLSRIRIGCTTGEAADTRVLDMERTQTNERALGSAKAIVVGQTGN